MTRTNRIITDKVQALKGKWVRPGRLWSALGRLDRRLLASVAIVAAVVGSLLIVGRTSAVVMAIESCAPSPVQAGTDVVCELSLTIRNAERLPIQKLEFNVSGPASFNI